MGSIFDFTNRQLKVLAVLSATAALLSVYLLARHWVVEPAPTELPAIYAADSDRDSPRRTSDGFVGAFVIDPNTAPSDSLELLPGIGPVKARLKRLAGRRWTKEGALVLQCDETDPDTLIQSINQAGAFRFVPKPWDDEQLLDSIREGLRFRDVLVENRMLAQQVRDQKEQLRNLGVES